jgi:hypothetical protein
MKRNTIELYNVGNNNELWGLTTVVGAFFGVVLLGVSMGLIFDPEGSTGAGLILVGFVGIVTLLHAVLTGNHINFGLERGGQEELAKSLSRLPKSMRSEIALSRSDIKSMDSSEAIKLATKMYKARISYNDMYESRGIKASNYLDSYIETRASFRNIR